MENKKIRLGEKLATVMERSVVKFVYVDAEPAFNQAKAELLAVAAARVYMSLVFGALVCATQWSRFPLS